MQSKAKIKAVFFDVDGTLVSFKTHEVSPNTIRAIASLRQKGIKCYVCSGRSIQAIKEMPINKIVFDGYITLNGQLGIDDKDDVIYEIPFDGEVKKSVIDIFNNKLMPMMLVQKDRCYHNFINETVINTYKMVGTKYEDIPKCASYENGEIYQAYTYIDPLNDDESYMEYFPKTGLRFASWASGCVDIYNDNDGKLEGIRRILDKLKIRKEETMAFGDAINDLEMLSYCAIGVAMGNSCDKLKQIADYITDDVDQDGVYHALINYGFLKEDHDETGRSR